MVGCDDPWKIGWRIYREKWVVMSAIVASYLIFAAITYSSVLNREVARIVIGVSSILVPATLVTVAARKQSFSALISATIAYAILAGIAITPRLIIQDITDMATIGVGTILTVIITGILLIYLAIRLIWAPVIATVENPISAFVDAWKLSGKRGKIATCTAIGVVAIGIWAAFALWILSMVVAMLLQSPQAIPVLAGIITVITWPWAIATTVAGFNIALKTDTGKQSQD